MNDLEKAIEELKFEHTLGMGQKIAKGFLVGIAGGIATMLTSKAFNQSVKAIRDHKTSS